MAYQPQGVDFDGTNDYLRLASDLTGASDSKLVTGAVWFNTSLSSTRHILAGDGFAFELNMSSGGITVAAEDTSGTLSLVAFESASLADGDWHHLMFSFDMSSTSKRHFYVDDSDAAPSYSTYIDATLDFTPGGWSVGARDSGSSKFPGGLAQLWFDPGTYIDFSVESNRRKFVEAGAR